jgi:hypothetical protein
MTVPTLGPGVVDPSAYKAAIDLANLRASLSPTGTDAEVGGVNPSGLAWNGSGWVEIATGLPANSANAAAIAKAQSNSMAQQIASNLVASPAIPSSPNVTPYVVPAKVLPVQQSSIGANTPSTQGIVPVQQQVSVAPTSFSLSDWLGISATPSPSLITGIPNWALAVGAGLLLMMSLKEQG